MIKFKFLLSKKAHNAHFYCTEFIFSPTRHDIMQKKHRCIEINYIFVCVCARVRSWLYTHILGIKWKSEDNF